MMLTTGWFTTRLQPGETIEVWAADGKSKRLLRVTASGVGCAEIHPLTLGQELGYHLRRRQIRAAIRTLYVSTATWVGIKV